MAVDGISTEITRTVVPATQRRVPSRSSSIEYVESLLITVLLALFGTTFVVQAFKIPSQSMEPTLLVGDHLLVNKFIFGGRGAWYEKFLPYRPISRGDVIVFKFPYDDHPHYVKRVIGLPGDRLRIINQRVYINGRPLDEPYVTRGAAAEDIAIEDFPPSARHFAERGFRSEWATRIFDYVDRGSLVIPPNRYFVMGDNRDQSWDSRYWGFVNRDAIMGRPLIVYWSVDATSRDYKDRGFSGAVHGFVDSLLHLPSRTRWNRMLHQVH